MYNYNIIPSAYNIYIKLSITKMLCTYTYTNAYIHIKFKNTIRVKPCTYTYTYTHMHMYMCAHITGFHADLELFVVVSSCSYLSKVNSIASTYACVHSCTSHNILFRTLHVLPRRNQEGGNWVGAETLRANLLQGDIIAER